MGFLIFYFLQIFFIIREISEIDIKKTNLFLDQTVFEIQLDGSLEITNLIVRIGNYNSGSSSFRNLAGSLIFRVIYCEINIFEIFKNRIAI